MGQIDRVLIDEKMRARALELEREVQKHLARRRGQGAENYTGLNESHRYAVGYIGELALSAWLTHHGVMHWHRIITDGASQRSEIMVGRLGELEVKTAANKYGNAHDCMMPAKQRLDFAVLVGARIERPYVRICGWLKREDCERMAIDQYKIPTRHIPYAEMRDNGDLLALCFERGAIIKRSTQES